MKTKTTLLTLVLIIFCFNLNSQNFWKTFRFSDGLIWNNVIDIAPSSNNIYLATELGLSVYDGTKFTNYDTSNSYMANHNISIIRSFNDTVCFVTDSGLTQFDGVSFKNYNKKNGLLVNNIQDIEYDSKGNLWIATLKGLSKKVGDFFMHDTTRKVYDIGLNSGDSIYANVNFNAIVNVPNLVTAELYFNNTWSTLVDTANGLNLSGAKFYSLANGRVGLTSTNEGAFYVSNDFKLSQINLPLNALKFSLTSMESDPSGRSWFASLRPGSSRDEGSLVSLDTGFQIHKNGLPAIGVNKVKYFNDKIYITTLKGFAIADATIKAFPTFETFEGGNYIFNNAYYGNIMTNAESDNNQFVSSFEFPKGSGRHLSYGGNLWLGSYVSKTELYLSSADYLAGNYRSGTINNNNTALRPNMISITKAEIDFHLKNYSNSGYIMPASIRDWPATGNVSEGEGEDQAPFIDVNNSNCYDPENGDYPAIFGDHALYIIYSDGTGNQPNAFNFRFDAEIHAMIYAYDRPGVDYLENAVFIRYDIINRSKKTYKNVKLGFYNDFDIGNPSDDAIGCDLSNDITYIYNGDNFDDNFGTNSNYDSILPVIGTKFLNNSLTGHIQTRNPHSSSGKIRNHIIDMFWEDSTQISVGGNGYNIPFTTPTKFLYPGRLDKPNEWSFLHPQQGFAPNTSGDARPLSRVDLNTWKPGERKRLDLIVGVGYDSTQTTVLGNYKVMLANLEIAARFQQGVDSITPKGVFSTCITGLDEERLESKVHSNLILYPNPSNSTVNIMAKEKIESLVIYDINGREVLNRNFSNQLELQTIVMPSEIKNGLYIVSVKTIDNQMYNSRLMLQK